jgi:hypothetical protein
MEGNADDVMKEARVTKMAMHEEWFEIDKTSCT